MTRVNLIPVTELTRQHLIAEHREIKRIPNAIIKGRFNLNNIPNKYTLGTGHVKFFYNKLLWLCDRQIELYKECKKRGYNVTDYTNTYLTAGTMYNKLFNDWTPTEQEIKISRQRINERLKK